MGRSTADQTTKPQPRSGLSTGDADAVDAREEESHHNHLVAIWAQVTMGQLAREAGGQQGGQQGEQQGDSLIAG